MNKIRRTLIIMLAACAALTACKQDETLRYNNVTMGNVTEGTFTSDQGNVFNVVEKNCTGNLEEMKRAFVICDVLNLTPGTENEYDVRLNGVAEVLVKDAISRNQADGNEESAVSDPIHINAFWISGGYVNMYLVYERLKDSDVKHLVNLVIEESETESGKYSFTLRHNSFGESLTSDLEDEDKEKLILAAAYVSFPLNEMIEGNSAELTFKWKWYKSAGLGISSETQEYSQTVSYQKGGYEQAPAIRSSKVITKLN